MAVKKIVKPIKITKKDKESIQTGKRKKAVARARVVNASGSGKLTVNGRPLEVWGTKLMRMWTTEPLIMAEDIAKGVDIDVTVMGGGTNAQAEAMRVAIAKVLVAHSKDKKLKQMYLDFDRHLLVYDSRRTEPHKPSRSKKGARIHKQRSKR
jgi:small subunit ribosomal protein S9